MSSTKAPKVFLSHASEDKGRFVIKFASELQTRGIDVWLDRWEMLPGDSLVDRIFEEGIKNADAILVVLSNFSINKPWVREELNASFVSRVSKGTKLIPVVLDDCEVPQALHSTLWESVPDLNNIETCIDRVVAAVFGQAVKPMIGNVPAYTQIALQHIGKLTNIDNLVLKTSCEYLLAHNEFIVEPDVIFSGSSEIDIPRQEISDSISVLSDGGYFSTSYFFGCGADRFGCHYQLSTYGLEEYARAYIDNYAEIVSKVISLIVNENLSTNDELSIKTGAPNRLIIHILQTFEDKRLIGVSKYISGNMSIYSVSASLRRQLQ